MKRIFRTLPFCLLCAQVTATAATAEWLNEADIIIPPGGARVLTFDVKELPDGPAPVLWMAPRTVFMMEERSLPTMTVEVNGTALGQDRLLSGSMNYRRPCGAGWPIPEEPKCVSRDGAPAWRVRFDDDFTGGGADFVSWRRVFAYEDLEPSYAWSLAGLVRAGKNSLTVKNTFDDRFIPREKDLTYPADPVLPWFSLHAKFARVGMIPVKEVEAYNAAHTAPFDPRPRTFDVLSPEGLEKMRRYYTEAEAQADAPEKRAFLRYIHANYELWKGETAAAQALLEASLKEDSAGVRKPQALFLLGTAQSRQGNTGGAERTWATLKELFVASPWVAVAEREALFAAGKAAEIANWPSLEARRAVEPIKMDGNLDDAAWKQAAPATAFSVYQDRYRRAPILTEVRVCYDDKFLYFGVVCHEPYMDEVVNPHTRRDDSVWDDDCIEIFLDPNRTYAQMFEFELGPEGGIVDCLNVWEISFMQYDPPRTDKISRSADRWCAEIAIPLESLGAKPPRPGDAWLCNIVRCRPKSAHRSGDSFVLGPSVTRFAAHETAAALIFR